ncbi:MAG: type I-U CRISPR-associated protein Csb2 [Methanothrix sp.]|nr:type I-U CRISPR-associated protein Csb2 [Methanothrix sp.]
MLAIEIRFPAGKYHATPWNRQVNEGTVEWPPAPWRILRTLISTRYHKLQAEIDEETIRKIIENFSASPQYFLPKASLGHTRHCMPLYRNTTLVIDTFAAIDRESRLIIEWPQVDLSIEEMSALSKLLYRIGYLGRAESWIETGLREGPLVQANCIALNEDSTLPDDFEGIHTLVTMPSQEYLNRRQKEIEAKRS